MTGMPFYFHVIFLLYYSIFCVGVSSRVVSLSLCARTECFISGSLDRTVLLWDQRADKCQVVLMYMHVCMYICMYVIDAD